MLRDFCQICLHVLDGRNPKKIQFLLNRYFKFPSVLCVFSLFLIMLCSVYLVDSQGVGMIECGKIAGVKELS